jgi:hypothetical protein
MGLKPPLEGLAEPLRKECAAALMPLAVTEPWVDGLMGWSSLIW